MAGDITWEHSIHDIPERGLSTVRHATPEELAFVASVLELVSCDSLSAAYTITPLGEGRYRVAGRVTASLQQACVVTLEPVSEQIDEPFEVSYWPASDVPAPESGEIELDDEPEVEPIVAGQIEVAHVVFECLAGAIDPFPRKADAAMDRVAAGPGGAAEAKPESPFAVLARMKDRH